MLCDHAIDHDVVRFDGELREHLTVETYADLERLGRSRQEPVIVTTATSEPFSAWSECDTRNGGEVDLDREYPTLGHCNGLSQTPASRCQLLGCQSLVEPKFGPFDAWIDKAFSVRFRSFPEKLDIRFAGQRGKEENCLRCNEFRKGDE